MDWLLRKHGRLMPTLGELQAAEAAAFEALSAKVELLEANFNQLVVAMQPYLRVGEPADTPGGIVSKAEKPAEVMPPQEIH